MFPKLATLGLFLAVLSPFCALSDNDEGFYNPDEEERREGPYLEIDDIGHLIIGYQDRAYDDISDELFRKISTYDITLPIGENTQLLGRVNRKVYDNRDGSYSVVDVFGVKGIVSTAEPMEIAGVPLYAGIGAEHGYDFVNIRQFDHKEAIDSPPGILDPDDPWYERAWNQIIDRWFGFRYFYDFMNATIHFFTNYFNSPSEELTPRYEDVLNIVRTPFRLPLDQSGFEEMVPGEIISYSVLGGVFVSLGSGFRQAPWHANVGVNFYARGAYRITVLKEKNGHFAKIKCSKLSSDGYSVSGQVKADVDLVEGVFFGSDLSASIVPVKFTTQTADFQVFDTIYRYDMQSEAGISAYEKAVYGNFISSQEASDEHVSRLFDRTTVGDSDAFWMNFNMMLFRSETSYQLDHSLITVTDENGVAHVFRSVSENEIRQGNLFRRNQEKINLFVDSNILLDHPDLPTGNNPFILISLFITDRDAYGVELRSYFQMIERLLQDPRYFDEGEYVSSRNYEKMSATMHLEFGPEAIETILSAPDRRLWSALARAFGVRPEAWQTEADRDEWIPWSTYLMAFLRDQRSLERLRLLRDATQIADHLRALRAERNAQERTRQIAQFHRDAPFQMEMLMVMLSLADVESVYKQLFVIGDTIESRDESWGGDFDPDRPNLYEDEDRRMEGQPVEGRSRIEEVVLSQGEALTVSFNTDIDPDLIEGFYVNIGEMSSWWFRSRSIAQTPVADELYANFSYDHNGRIALLLNPLLEETPLEVGKQYELLFAFRSRNGEWSAEHRLGFVYEP